MQPFDVRRAEVLGLFGPLLAAGRTHEAEEVVARLEDARERLEQGRLTVVICGEFKRGKSSLLNALLEEPGLLPTDTFYATNLVTTISYADPESVTALVEVGAPSGAPSDTSADVEELVITRDDIADYVSESQNPNNTRRARLISVGLANPKLASGLVLVDTPGVGGVYAEHTAVTMAFLPSADALVFVTDATQPLSDSELRFLRGTAGTADLLDDHDGLLFVMTKTDLCDYTELLDNTRTKVAQVTGRAPADVKIIAVSSKAKLDYLADGDPESLEVSGFPELERRVWTALSRRRTRVLLGAALTELRDDAALLIRPLQEQHDVLTRSSQEQVQAKLEEAVRREAELAELQRSEHSWKQDLSVAMNSLRTSLESEAASRGATIWTTVEGEYLHDDDYLKDPERLWGRISESLARVSGELSELASRRAAAIQRDLITRFGLSDGIGRRDDLPAPPVPPFSLRGQAGRDATTRGMNMAVGVTRGSGVGAAGGATAGAVVGGTVGAAIGFLFGGVGAAPGAVLGAQLGSALGSLAGTVFGGIFGGRAAAEKNRRARQDSIRQALHIMRTDHDKSVHTWLAATIEDYRSRIIAEVTSRIHAAVNSRRQTAEGLRRAGQATREEADRQLQALTAEIEPLVKVRDKVEELLDDLTTTGTGKKAPSGAHP